MAEHEKRAKRYPTDLTDAEWQIVSPFLPAPPKLGRKPTTDLREVLNALRYLARSGGGFLDDACDATPDNMTADELIATGWPKRLQSFACKALNLLRVRGRFSEENEEDAPSG
jgi:hypothetical protein